MDTVGCLQSEECAIISFFVSTDCQKATVKEIALRPITDTKKIHAAAGMGSETLAVG